MGVRPERTGARRRTREAPAPKPSAGSCSHAMGEARCFPSRPRFVCPPRVVCGPIVRAWGQGERAEGGRHTHVGCLRGAPARKRREGCPPRRLHFHPHPCGADYSPPFARLPGGREGFMLRARACRDANGGGVKGERRGVLRSLSCLSEPVPPVSIPSTLPPATPPMSTSKEQKVRDM